jgi:hypothetical protein
MVRLDPRQLGKLLILILKKFKPEFWAINLEWFATLQEEDEVYMLMLEMDQIWYVTGGLSEDWNPTVNW